MSGFRVRVAVCCLIIAGVLSLGGTAAAQNGLTSPTLETVQKRGQLVCGIDTGIPGYAYKDPTGRWQGLDVAYCRAIAAAIFGDPDRVKFIGTTNQVRFSVLQSGEIDVLIRDSEDSLTRNTRLGLMEPAVNFYTGQVFMVKKSLGVEHVQDLNGATICLLSGTNLETTIANYNRANNIKINTLLFGRPEEAFAAADAGRCDGYTDDGGSVAAARSSMKNPSDWLILPEAISQKALGSHTRDGDDRWTVIVAWVQHAMVEAEVLGITQANIDQVKATTKDPQTRLFLGLDGNLGKGLLLDNDFAYNIVKAVGNYGEIYDRTFGAHGLGLPRGPNNLYTKGGLQYSPSWY